MNDRKLIRQWEIKSERFSFNEIFEDWSRLWLAGLKLLLRDEHNHVVDGKNFSSNNDVKAKIFRKITKNLL